jgi:predicted RNase H-like HicB family nuclease
VIADLVVTVAIYRSGGAFLAVCPEFGVEATGRSPEDAKEEALAAVRRYLDAVAARSELEDVLAGAGFVVEDGELRAERRLVRVDEGRVTVPF